MVRQCKAPWVFPKEWGTLGEPLAPHTVREREATTRLSNICTCLSCDPKEAPAGKRCGVKKSLIGFRWKRWKDRQRGEKECREVTQSQTQFPITLCCSSNNSNDPDSMFFKATVE